LPKLLLFSGNGGSSFVSQLWEKDKKKVEKSLETSNAPAFESSQYCNSALQSDQFFLSKLLQNTS